MSVVGADIKVVEGQDGWLFLSDVGTTRTLDGFRDLTDWTRRQLPKLVISYAARARRMTRRGLPFVVVLAPEATGIYGDKLPEGVAIETPTMAEHLAEALATEGVAVVCPSMRLRAARGPIELFQKLDSHWSSFGAFLCYRDILEKLGRSGGIGWRDVTYTPRVGFGDLSVHVIPERSGPIHHASVPTLTASAGPDVYDDRARNVRHHTCPTGLGRALIFRDSFASALVPFLERTFAETIFVGGSPAMPDDAIRHFVPDVVILEVAERSLLVEQAPFADWSTSTFAQAHYERARNPSGGVYQVHSRVALERGDVTEAIAAAALAIAREGTAAGLHNLGHALLVAGQTDSALLRLGDNLCSVAAPAHHDSTLHWLHAQFAFMRGREAEAREALARALALEPDHAQFLYSRGVWDYLRGDYASAFSTFLQSIEGAPLHADSWDLAIHCARRLDAPELASLVLRANVVLEDHVVN